MNQFHNVDNIDFIQIIFSNNVKHMLCTAKVIVKGRARHQNIPESPDDASLKK